MFFLLMLMSVQTPCECDPTRPVSEELEYSAAVFIGTVERVNVPQWDGTGPIPGSQEYFFRVSRSWKEMKTGSVSVTIRPLSDCAYTFLVGKTYLVYAAMEPQSRKLLATNCSRTVSIEEADDDLAELPEPLHEFEP